MSSVAETSWSAWQLDVMTWGWIILGVAALVWEIVALVFFPGQEATAHMRPVFQKSDLAYFTAFGFWLGIGYHFLISGLWVNRWGL